jgi:WW domain
MKVYFASTSSLLGALWCIGQVHGFVVPTTSSVTTTTSATTTTRLNVLSMEAEDEMMMNGGRRHLTGVGLRDDVVDAPWNHEMGSIRPRGGPLALGQYDRLDPNAAYGRPDGRRGFLSQSYNRMMDYNDAGGDGGILQGQGSRAFWSPRGPQTLVSLGSGGGYRNAPVSANVEYWQGPGNIAQQVKTWSMDGALRPFQGEFETSGRNRHNGGVSYPGSLHIRNTGPMEFPAAVDVQGLPGSRGVGDPAALNLPPGRLSPVENIDGGALRTWTVDASVDCVRVHIRSEGGPVNALVEVWQGPGQSMQVAEVYADDGLDKPFTTMIQTPGYGTTIAVRNIGPMTFPIKAQIEKFSDPSRYPIRRPGTNRFNPGFEQPPVYPRMDRRFNPSGFDVRRRQEGWNNMAFAPGPRRGRARQRGDVVESSNGFVRDGWGSGNGSRFDSQGYGAVNGFYSGRNDSRRGPLSAKMGKQMNAMQNAAGAAAPSGWVKSKDPKTGRAFYANHNTRKTQWDTPSDWVENAETTSGPTAATGPRRPIPPLRTSTATFGEQYQVPDKKVEYTI